MPLRCSHWTLGADADAPRCVGEVSVLSLLGCLAAGASGALMMPDLEESRQSPRVAAAEQWEVAAHNASKGRRAPVPSAAPIHSSLSDIPAFPAHLWMSTVLLNNIAGLRSVFDFSCTQRHMLTSEYAQQRKVTVVST